MYSKMTRGVTVSVEPQFLEDQSNPEEAHYVWAYHVTIENNGTEPLRLRRRHWKITDGRGNLHEVEGEGVIGEQPLLHPGEKFSYTSGTPLRTSSGFMTGTYLMENNAGEKFPVEIPAFSLDSPHPGHGPVIN